MSKEMDKFRAARLMLIRKFVFFGSIAMMLELTEDERLPAPAGTDGKKLIFNPAMTEGWTFNETVAVIVHEVLHIVLLHHLRRKNRDHKRWNCACDYVINWEIEAQSSEFKLPEGALLDPQYKDMNAEQVYDELPEDPQGQGFDIVMDGEPGASEAEVMEAEARVKAIVQNAATLARKAGQMNGALEKLVEAVCEPKANWRAIVRDYLTAKAEIDYNWARPHQRMLHQYGIIFPTLDGEKLGKLVMIVDASGSCFDNQEQFCAEVSDILASYECEVDVIFHDTAVTNIDHYTSDDLPIVMRPAGFGGTDPVAAYAAANEFNPDLIIHLTDLEMDFSKVEVPECDVLIACSNRSMLKSGPEWARIVDIS